MYTIFLNVVVSILITKVSEAFADTRLTHNITDNATFLILLYFKFYSDQSDAAPYCNIIGFTSIGCLNLILTLTDLLIDQYKWEAYSQKTFTDFTKVSL